MVDEELESIVLTSERLNRMAHNSVAKMTERSKEYYCILQDVINRYNVSKAECDEINYAMGRLRNCLFEQAEMVEQMGANQERMTEWVMSTLKG